ncbi:MAG: type IV pilus modification protein PilV [Proteobacteria bacterium]|nr:type IV pilus modification protein PilV [Pseudomonadota bacterium]
MIQNNRSHTSSRQTGSMLLESLIAVLIFSMGILAIVGMQASAVKASSDAKYRSDASMVANQLIGEMWVNNRTQATLQANFQGGAGNDGPLYTAWLADVQAALPGAAANPPVVTVTQASLVTITVFWIAPGEPAGTAPHSFNVVAQII